MKAAKALRLIGGLSWELGYSTDINAVNRIKLTAKSVMVRHSKNLKISGRANQLYDQAAQKSEELQELLQLAQFGE